MTPQELLSTETVLSSPYGSAFVFGFLVGQVMSFISYEAWRELWR